MKIALSLRRKDFGKADANPFGQQLGMSAGGADFVAGGDVELAVGIGEDVAPLVATFGDDVATSRLLPGPFSDALPNEPTVGISLNRRRNFGGANRGRDIFSIEKHDAGPKFDASLLEKMFERVIVVGRDVLSTSGQRDGAVHRAGVEKFKTEQFG